MIQLSHMRWRLMAGMFALTIAIITAIPIQAKTADKLLADEVKPVFKPGHTLPALSRWGWSMSYETRVELADHWGYALEIGGYVTHSLVDRLESDPQDINARLVKLAQDNPGKYKVFVLTHRPLGGKRETYLIVSAVPISFEPPVVSVIPIDVDGMLPSQQAAAQVQKAYKALNQRMSH